MSKDWSQQQWDEHWMALALQLAEQAASVGEVPVGALIVKDGEVVGRGFNQPISGCDPTAHAEVVALRDAAHQLENYRLPGCTLYVTLEPCSMCTGALVHARIERLVFAATELKAGVIVSRESALEKSYLNHRVAFTGGVLAERASQMLSDFFQRRRLAHKRSKLEDSSQ